MKRGGAKWSTYGITLLIILVAALVLLFILIGGWNKQIIDTINAVIRMIEVGP